MRASTSLLAALAGVIALLFYLAAVPLQRKEPVAAPFCKTNEEHERQHGKHGAKHTHRAHRGHHPSTHQQHEHQQHVHVPPAVIPPAAPAAIRPIAPAVTLALDAFDAPSPLAVAEAEKAKRAVRR